MINSIMLIERIEAKGLKRTAIASRLGITVLSLRRKINGESEFRVSEVIDMVKLLGLTREDMYAIFFDHELIEKQLDVKSS